MSIKLLSLNFNLSSMMNRLLAPILSLAFLLVFGFLNIAIATDDDSELINYLTSALKQGGCLEQVDNTNDNYEYDKFYLRENQLAPAMQEKNIAVVCLPVPTLEENNLFSLLLCNNTSYIKNEYSSQITGVVSNLKKFLSDGRCAVLLPCQKNLPSIDSSGSGCAFGKCLGGKFCIPTKKELTDPRNPRRKITIIECNCVNENKAACGGTEGLKNFCQFGICSDGQYCTIDYEGSVKTCGCKDQSNAPSCNNAGVPVCVGKCTDRTGKEDPSLQCSLINDRGKPKCACKPLCDDQLAPKCDGACRKDPITKYPTGEVCFSYKELYQDKCSCRTPCHLLVPNPDGGGCQEGVGCSKDEICVRKDQKTCGCAKDCDLLTKACSGGSCHPEPFSRVDSNQIFLTRKCVHAPQRKEGSYDSTNDPVCGCYINNCGSLKTPEDCARVVSGCVISTQDKESIGICRWNEARKYCSCVTND
ncbi:MAG TPA: hypothetical protein PKD37_07910 [Oligoflexia bacterium]|nr:hypothetical protein [Oligoflexia bacterium]HMP27887.1 hypothetical protein [Oligoflexia bacterium]